MALWYHGTSINNALSIAHIGAVLSPWDQEILNLKHLIQKYPNIKKSWENSTPPKSLEQYALERQEELYSDYEKEYRVKSVSLTREIGIAENYAEQRRDVGGVILGFILSESREENKHIIYVPRKIMLEGQLKDVYVTKKAIEQRALIEEAFKPYGAEIRISK